MYTKNDFNGDGLSAKDILYYIYIIFLLVILYIVCVVNLFRRILYQYSTKSLYYLFKVYSFYLL